MSQFSLSLDEINFGMLEMAFEDNSFEVSYYLDLRENELIMLGEHLGVHDEEQLREKIKTDTSERFLRVPSGDTDVAWRDMQKFALSLNDEKMSEELLNTIQGSGAFGRFKNMIKKAGIRQDWHKFRNRRVRRRVLDWLMAKDLITEEQRSKCIDQLEKQINRRRQRQQDMREMGEGEIVECREPASYPGISKETRYKVVGERPEDNLVRINDDNQKQSWYPKNQFELIRNE